MTVSEQSRLMAAELAVIAHIVDTYGWQFLLPYAACIFILFMLVTSYREIQSPLPVDEHLAHLEGRIEHLEVTLLGNQQTRT